MTISSSEFNAILFNQSALLILLVEASSNFLI